MDKESDLSNPSNPSKEQPPPVATEGSLHKAERGQSPMLSSSARILRQEDTEAYGKVVGDQ
jgi:hypothetical protein